MPALLSDCATDTKGVKKEVVPRNDTEQGIFSGTGKRPYSELLGFIAEKSLYASFGVLSLEI